MATHKDETFEDATVDLDGETFENCTFRNVTLAYSGGEPPVLDGCKFEGFITRYQPDATPETYPLTDALVGHALAYYRDFVHPSKQ